MTVLYKRLRVKYNKISLVCINNRDWRFSQDALSIEHRLNGCSHERIKVDSTRQTLVREISLER